MLIIINPNIIHKHAIKVSWEHFINEQIWADILNI